MHCKECGEKLKQLQPEIEDIFDVFFCLRIPFTNIKLLLVNDEKPFECKRCLCEAK